MSNAVIKSLRRLAELTAAVASELEILVDAYEADQSPAPLPVAEAERLVREQDRPAAAPPAAATAVVEPPRVHAKTDLHRRYVARVLAVYAARPGEWLRCSFVAELSGVSVGTTSTSCKELFRDGELEHNGKGGAWSMYRVAAESSADMPPPVAPPVAPPVVPGGDQYAGRPLEDLQRMVDERGILLSIADREDAEALRRALRPAEDQGPSLYVVDRAGTAVRKGKGKGDDRRADMERRILAACVEEPLRPSAVASMLMRNQAEVRGLMLELCRRRRLRTRDGYSTFQTVEAA